ncbi:Ig-like domain-containing protein, partial [Archangium sp.]|uniref:Ig-like domain-containing protein n=1 Tax=Archangium sp. TaxID=1872627 RepID=UPI002ED8D506
MRRRLATLTYTPALLLSLAVLLTSGAAQAQAPTNNASPKLRYEGDLYGDFALIGSALGQNCQPETPMPLIGTTPANNKFVPGEPSCYKKDTSPDFFWTLDDWTLENTGATTRPYLAPSGAPATNPLLARTQAVLTLPPGAQVTYARLYWAATRYNSLAGDKVSEPDLTATLSRPGVTGFDKSLTADDYAFEYTPGQEYQYQSTADITSIVKAYGSGRYQVSDVLAIPLDATGGEFLFDNWWMVVFYELPGADKRHLKLFDSMKVVGSAADAVSFALSGFYVPPYAVDAKLGVVAFDGDEPDLEDTFSFNNKRLGNDLNPQNNFFNGTRSWTRKSPGVRTDTPLAGIPTGTDGVLDSYPMSHRGDRPQLAGTAGSISGMDLDVVDVTVAVGDKSAKVDVSTAADKFWLGGFVTSITTQAPDFTNTLKSARNLTRTDGTVRPGDTIEYTISTINVGDDDSRDTVLTDALPAQLDYVPGSLQLLTVAASDPTPAPRVLTDTKSDDDVGSYDPTTRTLTVYLGTGATRTKGGSLKRKLGASPGESTSISFQMKVKPTTVGKVENQAIIEAGGMLGIDPVKTPSRSPSGSGPTKIEVAIVPVPVITAPAPGSLISDKSPTYTGTSLPGTTVTVKLADGTPLCTATTDATGAWSCKSGTLLSEGPRTIEVVATDSSGNPSQPATSTFTVDTVAPATPVITSPSSGAILTEQRPVFTGTAEANSTVTVKVDGKVIGRVSADGTGKWLITPSEPLTEGPHTVSATATDAAGNTSSAASVPFSIAANPPETTITSQPPLSTTSTTASFTYEANVGVDSFECSLDGLAFVPCSASGKTYTELSERRHTFAVRARGYGGAVDPTPATYTWTVGIDTDKDGIPDSVETATGTDSNNDDTDGDGIKDGVEDKNGDGSVDPGETDPRKPDSDGDGIKDGVEDANQNGRVDADETDPRNPDSDNDGLKDGVEDTNQDGVVDTGETNPRNPDTDGGGVKDGDEDKNKNGKVDPGETNPRDPADDDTDGDGIPNRLEDKDKDGVVDPGETDPRSPDSDNDGISDGTEDTDKDGVVDLGET